MNYIRIFTGFDAQDVEHQVNVFLQSCRDRLVDIKIRNGEDSCIITLVMGTYTKYRQKKFDILECGQDAAQINATIENWREHYLFTRQLEDVVFINNSERVYLKIIYTEKDQIRERKSNFNR